MTILINIRAGQAVNGGALGIMTASGNPWPVSDAMAQELVNRSIADYVVTPPNPSGTLSPAEVLTVRAMVLADGIPMVRSVPPASTLVPDNTVDFQAALTAAAGGDLHLFPGADYVVSDTLIVPPGKTTIHGHGARITAQFGVNYSKALFKMGSTDVSAEIAIYDLRVAGNCVVLDSRFSGDAPNAGMKVFMDRIFFNTGDGARRAGTQLLLADQIDFCDISNFVVYNADMGFTIGSAPPRRNCTQIQMRLGSVNQVNSVCRLQGIDKAIFEGVDSSSANSGWHFAGNNQRLRVENSHVEGFGRSGYSVSAGVAAAAAGIAFYFEPYVQAQEVLMRRCTTIDPGLTGGSAVASAYMGQCDVFSVQTVRWEDCRFATAMNASAAYKPIINRGRLLWDGRWPFTTDVSTNANGVGYIETVIRDQAGMHGSGYNLMPSISPLGLVDVISGTAAPTITEVAGNTQRPAGWVISFNAVYELCKIVALPYGWCTVDVTGYRASGFPILYVQKNGSPFTDMVRVQFASLNDTERRWRISFWNPTANETYRVGFTNQSATPGADSLFMSSIAVYKGLAQTDPPRNAVEVLGAQPAASALWLGRTIIVRATGVADAVYSCLRDSGGTPAWVAK